MHKTTFKIPSIIRGPVREPDRILMQGVEGVGKSTFGASAPNPIFITPESGASQIGVDRFPTPSTFQDILDSLQFLRESEHDYKTVVVDTLDSVEPLAWAAACKRNGWTDIEDAGYGKGYTVVLDDWRKMLNALDGLRTARGMEVILLAHAVAKSFANPTGADYQRYEPAINKQAALLFKGWPDTILFATFEEGTLEAATGKVVTDIATKKRVKGVSTGHRVVKTQRSAGYDAKNRYNLPPELPLSYADYAAHRELFWQGKVAVDPTKLYDEAVALLPESGLADDALAKATATIESNKTNAPMLLKVLDRLRSLAAENAA